MTAKANGKATKAKSQKKMGPAATKAKGPTKKGGKKAAVGARGKEKMIQTFGGSGITKARPAKVRPARAAKAPAKLTQHAKAAKTKEKALEQRMEKRRAVKNL